MRMQELAQILDLEELTLATAAYADDAAEDTGGGPGDADITRLGEPRLFWGVSGGAIDSMVANTTALMKPRRQDDLTPGVENNKRPNRAVIAYCNLIRTYYKSSRPIVLGGLEASEVVD